MVTLQETRDALTDRWQTTVEVARAVPRTSRTFNVHKAQVYNALRRLAEDGVAEWARAGNEAIWRRI